MGNRAPRTWILYILSGNVRGPVDFGGGPKITFLAIMLEKNEKMEAQERFQKKKGNFNGFWMRKWEVSGGRIIEKPLFL